MLGHQADEREYTAAAAILLDLGIRSIRLMTNNPTKIDQLAQLGIAIDERLPLTSTVTQDNAAYLATKIERMRHLLTLPLYTNGHGHAHENGNARIASQLTVLHDRALAYHAEHRQPYVTLSYAQTLDGTIGAPHGGQLRISGSESLMVTHQLRARHDAILVGIGTVLTDDPQLTVRLVEGPDPQPIIIDSHLRFPTTARMWSHPTKRLWIATLDTDSPKAQLLRDRGARLIQLPATEEQQVDLSALFSLLGAEGIRSVMVEGGASIIANLIRQQLAHYAVVTVAPRYQPGIRVNAARQPALATFEVPTYTQVGSDMMLWGELAWAQHALSFDFSTASPANNFAASPLPTSPSPTVPSTI